MQVCTSFQTDNHASTTPLKFFTGRMPFLPPTNSVKALTEICQQHQPQNKYQKMTRYNNAKQRKSKRSMHTYTACFTESQNNFIFELFQLITGKQVKLHYRQTEIIIIYQGRIAP